MKVFFLLGALALLGTFGTVYGLSSETPFKLSDIGNNCHPACFEFVPNHASQDSGHQVIDFTYNQNFDVIMADGSCNIDGIFNQATNTCSAHSLVLTPNDFKTFQTNVASMYVGNIYSTNNENTVNYCTLAAWTWQHQTEQFQAKYNINNVIPPTCFSPVPDFSPSIALAVMILGTIITVVISRRHG